MLIKNRISILKKDTIILLLLIIEFSYFILCLTNTSWLLRVVFIPLSLFIIPGAFLLAILRRSINNIIELTVEGFFVSTIMCVILTSIMLMLGIPLIPFNYSLAVLILVSSFSIIALIRKIEFKPSKFDSLLVSIAFLSYIAQLIYLSGLPRLFTLDETSYIADMRDIVLKGRVASWSSTFSSWVVSLLTGRAFWLLLGASFLGATGLPSYQLNLLSCIFLPAIALTSSLLISPKSKDRKMLQIASAILTISNPLLVKFSGFILNDLALAFYTLFAIKHFIESFKMDNVGNVSIVLRNLALSLLSIFITALIKPNLFLLFPLYIIMIGFIVKNKLYRVQKYKAVLFALIIPVLAYEMIIDIPYVLVVWFRFGDESIRYMVWSFTKRFVVLGSPAELFLGWFITTPWHRTNIFSYDYFGYLNYLYRFLSPEALSLLFAGVGLMMPVILLFRKIQRHLYVRLLSVFTSISLILLFFSFLSNASLEDINRYSLFIYPLITVISLESFCAAFLEGDMSVLIALIIPSIFLIQMNLSLSIIKGGIYVGYGLPKINWTGTYLLFQLIIYLFLVVVIARAKKGTILLQLLRKYSFRFHLRKLLFLTFVASILLSNVYFTGVFFDRSIFFRDIGLKDLNELLKGVNTSLIFSNSFVYLRDFVSDEVYVNNYVLPLPMTKQELDHLISKGFNGTRIVVTEDPAITSYEYAKAYKKDLLQGVYLLPAQFDAVSPDSKVLGPGCVMNLIPNAVRNSFDDISEYGNKGIAYNTLFVKDEYGNGLLFNGRNSFVEFEHNSVLNVTDALTVRIWFRTSSRQRAKFLLEKGDPYSFGIYLTANSTVLSFYVRLAKKGVVAVNFNGTFDDNRLYDVVGVFDGRYVQLYVNGLLRANVDIGFKDTIVASSKPLWIGTWAKGSFFNGTIYGVQIYNRALSSLEILTPYLKDRPYGKPVYETISREGRKIIIYQVEGPITLRKSGSDISVNNVQVDTSNYLLPVLKINVSSPRTANLTIIIGTLRFSKIFDAKIEAGNNTLEYPFEYKLPDGRSYGFYVASRCRVIIVDENGNVIYDNILERFQLTGNNLLVFVLLLTSVLILYVALSSNRFTLAEAEKD